MPAHETVFIINSLIGADTEYSRVRFVRMANKVPANAAGRYIYMVLSHWLRLCSIIDGKLTIEILVSTLAAHKSWYWQRRIKWSSSLMRKDHSCLSHFHDQKSLQMPLYGRYLAKRALFAGYPRYYCLKNNKYSTQGSLLRCLLIIHWMAVMANS